MPTTTPNYPDENFYDENYYMKYYENFDEVMSIYRFIQGPSKE